MSVLAQLLITPITIEDLNALCVVFTVVDVLGCSFIARTKYRKKIRLLRGIHGQPTLLGTCSQYLN